MTNRERIEQRLKQFGLNHAEAFCLMIYRSKDGQEEWLWNSRDGVTPFCIVSRDGQEMQHVEWHRDEFRPNHQPKVGDRIFVDVTRELAEPKLREYIDQWWDAEKFPMRDAYGDKEHAFRTLLPSRTEAGQPFVLELTEENISQYVKPDLEKQIETLSQQAASLKAPSEQSSGTLQVGHNGGGEVVINLGNDITGHIVFTPGQARNLADCLQRQAKLAEDVPTISFEVLKS